MGLKLWWLRQLLVTELKLTSRSRILINVGHKVYLVFSFVWVYSLFAALALGGSVDIRLIICNYLLMTCTHRRLLVQHGQLVISSPTLGPAWSSPKERIFVDCCSRCLSLCYYNVVTRILPVSLCWLAGWLMVIVDQSSSHWFLYENSNMCVTLKKVVMLHLHDCYNRKISAGCWSSPESSEENGREREEK